MMEKKSKKDEMSSRERWLAAMDLGEVDRLPFWAKLGESYVSPLVESHRSMSLDEMHAYVGSEPPLWVSSCVKERRKRTRVEREELSGETVTRYISGRGETRLVMSHDALSCSSHPVRHPVGSLEELEIFLDTQRDTEVEFDSEQFKRTQDYLASVGEDRMSCAAVGESPLMEWIEYHAGVENGHLLLADHGDKVEELFSELHRILLRKTAIMVERLPVDVLFFIENTSTTLISPRQYQEYCHGQISAYAAVAKAGGKRVGLHMCGYLKNLLGDLSRLDVHCFEAFTSPPVGDTSLRDGREACPGKCLVGGTNAALWTRSAVEIISELRRHLDELPHHRGLVPSSAGMMPPSCDPETIREVSEFIRGYPVVS